jgi:sugar/nucleoside kinase (ribokinase family)
MTIDVAVVGTPFLDLTFEGLERVPRPGEELVATALHVAPGGTGMQAIGAARLGLRTALVAPLGRRGMARLLGTMLENEGVIVLSQERDSAAVPATALLPTTDGVAMATVLLDAEPSPQDVEESEAGAVIVSAGRLPLAPRGATTYVVTGGLELNHIDADTVERFAVARAVIVNAAEVTSITGCQTPEDGARALAGNVSTAVVTMGADGAVAATKEQTARAPAPRVDVVDATGAGDLFVAAYVWADLRGSSLEDRLAWACLYAGLSVRARTALAGAVSLPELLSEGEARGLKAPG